MLTNEEKLELAKKCGAKVVYEGAQHTIFFESQLDLSAYTSALEQKYQAQIAMLLHKLARFAAAYAYAIHDKNVILDLSELNEILENHQATADAFIAEVKARALEELAERFMQIADERDSVKFHNETLLMAAELRNQQEGKDEK